MVTEREVLTVRGAQNDVTGEDRMAANGALGGLAGE